MPDNEIDMVPVADFQVIFDNETKAGEQVMILRPNMTVKWPAGRTGPPRDTPECGFHGELCLPSPADGNIIWFEAMGVSVVCRCFFSCCTFFICASFDLCILYLPISLHPLFKHDK